MDYFSEFDWATTPLGGIETWPPTLKTTYDIMMSSGFAMCAMWGPEKTFLYNRAYAPFLGKRHPAALGMPMPEVWHEIWDEITPIIERAMSGEAVYMEGLHLVMTRNGYEEDTYWTFSYSPLRDDDGSIVGFLHVAHDVTETIMLREAMEKRAESLIESEARLLKLVTAGAYSIYRMSPDWTELRQLDGNGILEDTLQPSVKWLDAYIDEADKPQILEAINDAIVTKSTFELEHRVKLQDGGMGWVFSRAVPIIDAHGDIVEWFGAASDITPRKHAEEQQNLLNQEVGHRLKNILSIVQSIVSQTLRNAVDTSTANQALTERIGALARAQNALLSGERTTSDIATIVQTAISPANAEERISIEGPFVKIGPACALNLTLTVNELVTNAIKYGALFKADGRVSVRWGIDGHAFWLSWEEAGGPPVTAPARKGFGSRLLENSLLGGSANLRYEPSGVVYTLEVSLVDLRMT
ncbi:PAS domain-containing protein [Agrobacterium larrymoorei]|uniref:sensor histidine kinase n=1 Tax=Agrobacterium larrymoorei TaxID=160699 RepID=UPI0015732BF3|nr:HWE histidine kinase domain-containing protein [Agrobacterium larrymoorei]NTJ43651.1 PAS domain-containing protein [Agrobacterium larrymoorei]